MCFHTATEADARDWLTCPTTNLHNGQTLLSPLLNQSLLILLFSIIVLHPAGKHMPGSLPHGCVRITLTTALHGLTGRWCRPSCLAGHSTYTSSEEESWSAFMPSERLPLNLSSSRLLRLLRSRSRDVDRREGRNRPKRSRSLEKSKTTSESLCII